MFKIDSDHKLKIGLAEMLKGGVIMDVTTPEQAKIAENAGAAAVMALERIPADIRIHGGVARMSNPTVIKNIMEVVSIPVMAKCRIGHFAEAQVLQSLGVDFIDESEVLTPADDKYHVDKWKFKVPFVCGCRELGEALRRVSEGAAMIRTKGEAGSGNIIEAVRHMRMVQSAIMEIKTLPDEVLVTRAKEMGGVCGTGGIYSEKGKTTGAKFCCGWYCYPSRCLVNDAVGCGIRFCGIGHF